MEEERGTLKVGEPHPSALIALEFIKTISYTDLCLYQGAFSSCAIEGNRLGEICAETLNRLLKKEPVSDRYLLGLAWAIRDMEDNKERNSKDRKRERN